MELRNLRTFQTVADQGSYQKAAAFLGYTQSTVTIQIQQLEEELGVPLFERVGRRRVLTQVGEQVLAQARELLSAADHLSEIARTDQALTGTLHVDIVETLLCYHMQPVIQAFREQAPQVRLVIHNCNCLKISENLKKGICDLGVCYAMDWNRDVIHVETLDSFAEIILLAASGFSDTDFVTPHQVKPVSLIIDEPDSLFRRQLEEYLRSRDIILDETIELWSTEAIKRCVMSGLGITFLPRFTVKAELESKKLIELDSPISGIRNPVLSVRHKNRYVTPAMELFMRLLREYLPKEC